VVARRIWGRTDKWAVPVWKGRAQARPHEYRWDSSSTSSRRSPSSSARSPASAPEWVWMPCARGDEGEGDRRRCRRETSSRRGRSSVIRRLPWRASARDTCEFLSLTPKQVLCTLLQPLLRYRYRTHIAVSKDPAFHLPILTMAISKIQ
jgi:hypothetical protein